MSGLGRKAKNGTPMLPMEAAPVDRLYMRKGRRAIYALVRHGGKVYRRSTQTTFKGSAEEWLRLARKQLDRLGVLPAANDGNVEKPESGDRKPEGSAA